MHCFSLTYPLSLSGMSLQFATFSLPPPPVASRLCLPPPWVSAAADHGRSWIGHRNSGRVARGCTVRGRALATAWRRHLLMEVAWPWGVLARRTTATAWRQLHGDELRQPCTSPSCSLRPPDVDGKGNCLYAMDAYDLSKREGDNKTKRSQPGLASDVGAMVSASATTTAKPGHCPSPSGKRKARRHF